MGAGDGVAASAIGRAAGGSSDGVRGVAADRDRASSNVERPTARIPIAIAPTRAGDAQAGCGALCDSSSASTAGIETGFDVLIPVIGDGSALRIPRARELARAPAVCSGDEPSRSSMDCAYGERKEENLERGISGAEDSLALGGPEGGEAGSTASPPGKRARRGARDTGLPNRAG